MKKFMKKNNKGFSLVELIVVVLIIAIIAVALAPQVTKWVSKASQNTDENNKTQLKGSFDVAIAEYMITNSTAPSGVYHIKSTGISDETSPATTESGALLACLQAVIKDYPQVKSESGKIFVVTVTSGVPSVTTATGTY